MNLALFFCFFFAILTFVTPIPSFAIFFIILFFFSSAYIMHLLGASFLAMIILIVYVGAIAILFVFCVILFERTPVYSNYFYYRAILLCSFLLSIFYFFINFFILKFDNFKAVKYTPYFTPKNKLWPTNQFDTYSVPIDFTFLDAFASFFFITNQGLFYILMIGFFLFFFTVSVVYIFYFTKK